jgi:hypothetical protein
MSDFLEKLKNDMQEAQSRFQVAQQRYTAAQAEAQAAQQRLVVAQTEYALASVEFQAHQTLINMHTRKEQQATDTAPEVPAASPASSTVSQNAAVSQPTIDENKSEGNKTETVREFLRQHPVGMTPGDIWKQLESQMGKRAYLYSILKRLKDRGDVREKRGKYYLNPKPEVNQGQTMVQ